MKAGELRQRFTFSTRVETDDGLGNKQGEWIDHFTVWGKRVVLRGGESVMADRLVGRAPAILTIRHSIQAAEITPDWRCTDARTGELFNIRQVMPGEKRDAIEMLIERGVAI